MCQHFSKDSAFGKVLGYKEDHYATVYDTTRRMPVVTMATVQSLADEKWPVAPLMIEQGKSSYTAQMELPTFINWDCPFVLRVVGWYFSFSFKFQ